MSGTASIMCRVCGKSWPLYMEYDPDVQVHLGQCLETRIAALERQVAAMCEALEMVEWCDSDEEGSHCYVCSAADYEGHTPDCELGNALEACRVQ